MGARIDETKLIGEVYDRLKIVKTYREGKHIMCNCDCVCGGHKSHIRFSALKDGSTRSCGCLQKEIVRGLMTKYDLDDLIGEEYGDLTIIDACRKTNKSLIYCNCLCKCGKIAKNIQYSALKNGTTKSCGCLHDRLSAERLSKQRKKYNKYQIGNGHMIGICYDNSKFIFDTEDYDKVKEYCWRKDTNGYVVAYDPYTRKTVWLHRVVMNCPDGYEVDHIHHVVDDNRKSELRICKLQENALNKMTPSHNTSGHKNVQKKGDKWYVVIKKKYIGRFESFEEACRIEEETEKQMYGEYSVYSN